MDGHETSESAMNRNTRLLIYLFFAAGLIAVMMDCSRRMQHRPNHSEAPQGTP
jgi:preprotein translocase subunit SecG